MKYFTRESSVASIVDSPAAAALFATTFPGIEGSDLFEQIRELPIAVLVDGNPALKEGSVAADAFWSALTAIEDHSVQKQYAPAIAVDPAYEAADIARASARLTVPAGATAADTLELVIDGPSHGNPYVDVELSAVFSDVVSEVRVRGFYDGGGRYRVRFLPPRAGEWHFTLESSARSIDGLEGSVSVADALPGRHGPVRVADGFHFAYADGTRYTPVGTTLYAWTHQPESLQQQTLTTLASSPFNKVRMGVFPKSYFYNSDDPDLFPFERDESGAWDFTRFSPEYFARLEARIRDLDQLGIEADIILFHPYDRWGFTDMGPAVDERYASYVVSRLAAFPNVWWSLANEFDLVWSKTEEDWERLASVVTATDSSDHLISIHNCLRFYDYSKPWVTHVSNQRIDIYRTSENTDQWRTQWDKPVVVDEVGYEGDLDLGWGNLSGHEVVRRFWEGTVRGGYLSHGETYYSADDTIFWAKGGTLRGTSPERIAFLRTIIDESPSGVIDPLPSEWDVPSGGVADEYIIIYFGFNRPRFRTVTLPAGHRYEIDIIDTWNMTIETLPGVFAEQVRVDLPAREYMALRLRRLPAE